jgi:predicted dehydrogenase
MQGALIGFSGETAGALPQALAGTGDRFKITAICEEDPELLKKSGRAFPEAALYRAQETLLSRAEKLEFGIVCCPAWKRTRAARRALENRLNVLCSVPFCFSTSDFEDLRAAAAAAGRVLSCLQPWERSAAWLSLEKALAGGLLGRVRRAEAKLFVPGPVPEGGITAAAGWKAFSLLLAAVRLPPRALSARLLPAAAPGVDPCDASASLQVQFGDADGCVYLAAGAHSAAVSVSVFGEKGRAELDGDMLRLDVSGVRQETVRLRDSLAEAARPEWLAAELADFEKEVKGELPAGYGLRNARYCAKLLRNAYYSSSVNSSAVPL